MSNIKIIRELKPKQREELLKILQTRFDKNMNRHKGLDWAKVQAKLESSESVEKLWSLYEMERTGGEPDVIAHDNQLSSIAEQANEFIFYDCSPESPKGRRSLCYDREALVSRKDHKPENSAVQMAVDMGIVVLSEDEYKNLQKFGNFDLKTSSWIKTPPEIRNLGGALFCDRRYNNVFVYHNGAESYYSSRGFRGVLKV